MDVALEGLASLTQQDFAAVRTKSSPRTTKKLMKNDKNIDIFYIFKQVRAVKQPSPSIKLTMEAICLLR